MDDRTVRLVPAFDEYTLGYRGRDLALDPAHATRILAGGIVHPAAVAGGRILGTWRQRVARGRLTVTVEPFRRLPRGVGAGLEAEAADLGRFPGSQSRPPRTTVDLRRSGALRSLGDWGPRRPGG